MTEESFNKSRKHALTCFNDLNALRRPWLAKFSAKMKQEEYKGMRAEYEKLLGDPTPGSEFYNNIIMPEIRRMEQEMAQQTEQVESPQQRIDSQYRQRIMADSRKRP